MLTLLRISGFALIDEVELAVGPGLTVITGETGAGKSILVDALGLLRGGRGSTELIRSGRDEAQVEAVFELPGGEIRQQLEAQEVLALGPGARVGVESAELGLGGGQRLPGRPGLPQGLAVAGEGVQDG